MPTLQTIFAIMLCVIFHSPSFSQTESPHEPEQGKILARLSYTSTYEVNENDEKYLPRVCFELYRDGHYRIVRATTKGVDENRKGKLPQDQLAAIDRKLMQLDFKNSPAGFIRKGSESFVAEVQNGAEERRLFWVDPDHQRPFPDSAVAIISWLQGFTPQGASPIAVSELSTDPSCPRVSLNALPVAASAHRASCACLSRTDAPRFAGSRMNPWIRFSVQPSIFIWRCRIHRSNACTSRHRVEHHFFRAQDALQGWAQLLQCFRSALSNGFLFLAVVVR